MTRRASPTSSREANKVLDGAPLHALVNNAGMSPKTPYKERLGCLNGDLDAWHDVLEINFFAPLRLARGFAGALHRGKGAIVNVTSIAGHAVHPFAGSAYSISKAALSALTRELAHECAALDVRVNAVAPGEIETDMIQPEYDVLIPRIPLERMGSPLDVAQAIFYLCSPTRPTSPAASCGSPAASTCISGAGARPTLSAAGYRP